MKYRGENFITADSWHMHRILPGGVFPSMVCPCGAPAAWYFVGHRPLLVDHGVCAACFPDFMLSLAFEE